jgi:hypothetical protein
MLPKKPASRNPNTLKKGRPNICGSHSTHITSAEEIVIAEIISARDILFQ